jgi:tetratricopeptide (TPR) repeat protein/predicted ATPase
VGRAQELAGLDRHLAGSPEGSPPLLLLAGEPGIGKSRLLDEVGRRGAEAGCQVLRAGCARSGGQLPYTPLLQALQRQIGVRPAAQRRALLRGCAWLVRLLPELAEGPIEPLRSWPVAPEQERRLMFEAVERFLANVAGPAGTLLLLDDLQWAGADALDLLASLVRASPTAPLRLVGAYRDTEAEAGGRLATTLADLAGAGLARHCRLRPLAAAEVHHLVDLLLDGRGANRAALAARVMERTGGVPFFVVSCAQALREDGEDGGEAIPWEAAQVIRQRVAALPAGTPEVLGAAAIAVGRKAQAPVLAAVLEQPEHAVLAALEAAWRARLLDDVDGGYRLAHDLIREVLEADLGPARRALLHRRTAESLEGRPGAATAEVLAYHYGRGDMPERAVGYLEQAGDHALAQHGRAAAEGSYREAADRLDRLSRPLDAARVREKLGLLLHTSARYADALAALGPAAAAYRAAGDLEAVGRIVIEIGAVHNDRGAPAEGLAQVQPALGLLAGQGPSPVLAGLYTTEADLLYMLGRFHEDLAATTQAEQIARSVGDGRRLGEALHLRAVALWMLGRLAEAAGVEAAAIPVLQTANVPFYLCNALWVMGTIHQDRGCFAAAQETTQRALQVAEQHGFRMAGACATMQHGWLTFLTGDWAAARRDLEQAVAIGDDVGSLWSSVYMPLALGSLCLAEGDDATAARHLAEGERLLRTGDRAHAERLVACVRAARDLLAGCPEAARARLAPLLEAGAREYDTTAVQTLLAQALLDLGEVAEAAELVSEAVARARAQGMQVLLVEVLRVAALVATREGRWDEASCALQEGLTLARQLGYPYGEALLLQVAGALAAHTEGPEVAGARRAEALAIFRRLGARTDLKPVAGLVSCW